MEHPGGGRFCPPAGRGLNHYYVFKSVSRPLPPPQTVFPDCSRAAYDGGHEWPPFNIQARYYTLFHFQVRSLVRSLTYDVISKPPECHKMSQLCNVANDSQSFSDWWRFQKVTSSRVLTFFISQIFHAGHLSSGQSRDLPIISLWRNTEIVHAAM